jgi:hypothetical protein
MDRFSSRKPARRVLLALGVALGVALVIAAAIVVPLKVFGVHSSSARNDSPSTTSSVASGTKTPTLTQTACAKSGCAVVNTVMSRPEVTVFYGASCTGPTGSWYLNVTQGGPNDRPRPSYKLQWVFSPKQSSARPNGLINVSSPAGEQIAMTLANGVLRVTGRAPNGVAVHATGALVVGLSRTASGLALTFTETGVAAAQQALGISSPFGTHGQPSSVPVKLVREFASC